jgi:hypothetical protein
LEERGRVTREDFVWGLPEKARRILKVAAVEAYGKARVYVVSDRVMGRASVADAEEFRAIAQHLQARKWIAEADDDYGIFVLTTEGLDEAMDYPEAGRFRESFLSAI